MTCQLEHANVTVLDIDESAAFLTMLFAHWRVRGGGESDQGTWRKRWLHVGTDEIYIALEQTTLAAKTDREPARTTGINHVGFAVDSVAAIRQKAEAAGYPASEAEPHPYRKRLYVTDHSGITWEFIEYLSGNPAERNDYSL